MSKSPCTDETREKIKTFQDADMKFKIAWDAFEQENADKLAALEALRENRNALLDEAKRAVRQDTETMTDMRATYTEGPFKVQKKWSDFYIPEKTVSMIQERGLFDLAVASKIVAVRTEVAPFAEIKAFLKSNNLEKDFECCEDGAESSTAITGPKPIPPLGSELKKE